MITVIFWILVLTALAVSYNAISTRRASMYWTAGLLWYVVAFLGAFSIGLYILLATFICWCIAFGYNLRAIKKSYQELVIGCVGLAIGVLCIFTIDDYYLFFPFTFI